MTITTCVDVSASEIARTMADDEEFAVLVLREIAEVVPETEEIAQELGHEGLLALEAFVRKLREAF